MLETGLTATKTITVSDDKTALAMGSGSLAVFATPAMIALMEGTACAVLEGQLEEGQTTVGTSLDVAHLAPTPVGMDVTCEAELVAIDRKALTFKVTCFDETGKVGEGTHGRFVVDAEKFQAKADGKRA